MKLCGFLLGLILLCCPTASAEGPTEVWVSILPQKFIVDRIGYESVDLRFVGFPDVPARRLPVGG